ncbi:hypothetical protein BCI9360_03709 [Bacillus sp. CECT 9360]|nr:hypothetical protein BCI9360_03709 [Bacillus sp. CECT 9360]
MLKTLDYLTLGSDKQRQAHRVINSLGIMNELSMYTPVLCGTLSIEVDVEGSDLDIIMEVADFNQFEKRVRTLYEDKQNFKIKRLTIRDLPVIKANFIFEGFEF